MSLIGTPSCVASANKDNSVRDLDENNVDMKMGLNKVI